MTSTAVNLVYGYALFPSVNENIHLIDQSYLASRIETISVITGQSRPRPKSVSKKLLTMYTVCDSSGQRHSIHARDDTRWTSLKSKNKKTKNKKQNIFIRFFIRFSEKGVDETPKKSFDFGVRSPIAIMH